MANHGKKQTTLTESEIIANSPFKGFAMPDVSGHNTSIVYLIDTIESVGGKTLSLRDTGYRDGRPGAVIEIIGQSGIEYNIKVRYYPNRLQEFNRIMPELLKNGGDAAKILADFCGLIVDFDVYAYDSDSFSWDRICIDAPELFDSKSENNVMPHKFDAIASLVLCLNNDLAIVKMNSEMHTLRRYICKNWPQNYLLNGIHTTINHDEYHEIIVALKAME